jgi:diguanylate cyclase (GGDEF)-like protein
MTHDRPRILAIDDTPANLMTLGAALGNEFDFQIATSGHEGLTLAAQRPPDIIILDVMMPEMDGFETCRRLKNDTKLQHVPVIFLTSLTDPDAESTGLALGAADYLTKPINIDIAKHRIRNLLERQRLYQEVAAQRDQLLQYAYFDTLTKLPNRRLLNDRLTQTIATSKRSRHYGALMFLDLDNFKPLNDVHGHEVGDLLLIEAASRIKHCVREIDTVARFGGDEFVVVLSDLHSDPKEATVQAGIVAEKIRSALFQPFTLSLHRPGKTVVTVEHHCTASIGVTLLLHDDAHCEADFLKWADAAMYQAKKAGRNQIRFYATTA